MRPSGRSLSHEGHDFEGDFGNPVCSCLFLALPDHEMSEFVLPCAHTMVCCLATGSDAMESTDHRLKSLKLWTKITFLLNELITLSACYSDGKSCLMHGFICSNIAKTTEFKWIKTEQEYFLYDQEL
jgi:hypothetical protein